MSMVEIPLVVLHPDTGKPIDGAQVRIYVRNADGTTGAPAVVFPTAEGGAALTQPLRSTFGKIQGWLPRGRYMAEITAETVPTTTEPFDISPAGDGMVDTAWLGTNAVTNAKIADNAVTTSKIAQGAVTGDKYVAAGGTTFPTAPIDGQLFHYVADATNGIVWTFRFRSASAATFKWEFVGGSPLHSQFLGTAEGITSTSFVAFPTNQQITLPLAGDYDVEWGAIGWIAAAGTAGWLNFTVGGVAAVEGQSILYETPGGESSWIATTSQAVRRHSSASAGQVVQLVGKASANTFFTRNRFVSIKPVRVSA